MNEVIAFSKEQQAAFIGHAFEDVGLWTTLDDTGVSKEWFIENQVSALFEQIVKYREKYGRPPAPEELLASIKNETPEGLAAYQKCILQCINASASHAIDILRSKLGDWAKSRLIVNTATEVQNYYNKGDHEQTYKLWSRASTELERIDATIGGGHDSLESSAIRITRERAGRLADTKKILQYGISVLDDALVGIIPHDLILIGARSGAGKTELAKIIAKHNAAMGKRVTFFALEAEENEIEMRIKFGMLSGLWAKDNPGVFGIINYPEWRMGFLEGELGKYEGEVEKDFKAKYSTLKTYYRVRGDFGIPELDREILKVYKDSDLIILDHLHYVDLDGESENAEMKALIKRLRHMALNLGVPIICVAHIRKSQGKPSLCPGMDDFHGSSDITKIATTAIMLASAPGMVTCDSHCSGGAATFIRIVKCRLDGQRLINTAVSWYDRERGVYHDNYSLGRLNLAETKWVPLKDQIPRWARHALVTDVSELGG